MNKLITTTSKKIALQSALLLMAINIFAISIITADLFDRKEYLDQDTKSLVSSLQSNFNQSKDSQNSLLIKENLELFRENLELDYLRVILKNAKENINSQSKIYSLPFINSFFAITPKRIETSSMIISYEYSNKFHDRFIKNTINNLLLLNLVSIFALIGVFSISKYRIKNDIILPIEEALEFSNLNTLYNSSNGTIESLINKKIIKYQQDLEKEMKIDIRRKFSHELKSPINSLKSILHDLSDLSDQQKGLYKNSILKIQDSLSKLMGKSDKENSENLAVLVKEILISFPSITNIMKERSSQLEAYSNINKNVFKVLMTNILRTISAKSIKIDINSSNMLNTIDLEFGFNLNDKETLSKLLSFKTTSQIVEEYLGEFKVNTDRPGVCRLSIILPKSETPINAVTNLDLKRNTKLVLLCNNRNVLRDFTSVIEAKIFSLSLDIVHFEKAGDFLNYTQNTNLNLANSLYIIDEKIQDYDLATRHLSKNKMIFITNQSKKRPMERYIPKSLLKLVKPDNNIERLKDVSI